MRAFIKNIEDQKKIQGELDALNVMAKILTNQKSRAMITITAIDIEKFENLNLDFESKKALNNLSQPEGFIMLSPPPGLLRPNKQPLSRQEVEDMQKRDSIFENSQQSSLCFDNSFNPELSLKIIEVMKTDLAERLDVLKEAGIAIYNQILNP